MNKMQFIDRFTYFDFYLPSNSFYLRLKCIVLILLAILSLKYFSIYLFPINLWLIYIGTLSFWILHTRRCKYLGYFLFPDRIVRELKAYRKNVDIYDFDSIMSLKDANTRLAVISTKQDYH